MILTKPRLVTPVSDFAEGITRSNCRNSDLCDHLKRLRVELPSVTEAKSIQFICLSIPVQPDSLVRLLEKEKKTPCRNGASYFLGYLKAVTESDIPQEIHDCHLVAYDPESTIRGPNGLMAFICCRRDGKGTRNLDIAFGAEGWSDKWAFLVEDAVAVGNTAEPTKHRSQAEDTAIIYTADTPTKE